MNNANTPTRRETLKMLARGSGAAIGLPLVANADAAEKSSRPRRLKIPRAIVRPR